jgi:hypothetical protein
VRRRVPSAPIEDVKKASGVVDVDQAHLHGAKGFGKLAFTAIMFVAEPRPLGTPEKLFGFPRVGAAAGETELLEAH